MSTDKLNKVTNFRNMNIPYKWLKKSWVAPVEVITSRREETESVDRLVTREMPRFLREESRWAKLCLSHHLETLPSWYWPSSSGAHINTATTGPALIPAVSAELSSNLKSLLNHTMLHPPPPDISNFIPTTLDFINYLTSHNLGEFIHMYTPFFWAIYMYCIMPRNYSYSSLLFFV